MTKEEAQQRLAELRWALDSLPDDANIINFAGNGSNDEPVIHVDRQTITVDPNKLQAKRWDMETVEHYRHVGNVRVFGLVQSPVPEGI